MKTDRRKPHGTRDFHVADPGDELHFGHLRVYFGHDGEIMIERSTDRTFEDTLAIEPTGEGRVRVKLNPK